MMVDQRVAARFNVRETLSGWISPGSAVNLLFVRPELLNKSAVSRKLVRSYPPHLRDNRIGGDVLVAISVDTAGFAKSARVLDSSNYPELDNGAKTVAEQMQFKPVRLDSGCAVPAVLQMPIVYRSN